MQISRLVRHVVPLLLAVVSVARAGEPQDPPQAETSFRYSPYVVNVEGEAPYRTITFKDAGLADEPGKLPEVYEEIAQSLSLALGSELNLAAEVTYSEELTHAEAHLACETEHIYVDLWQAASEERVGFSLWSGCGEDARFALSEADRDELAHNIASALDRATATNCFQTNC